MSVARAAYLQVADTWAITKRNLYRYMRLPQLLVFSTIQPIVFLLLFNYVFGGALTQGALTGSYIDYFLPGFMIQMVLFGAVQTGVGLAEDMNKGIIDRFRSLPMSRAAVMAGRTLSDSIRNIFVATIVLSVGVLIGFRFHNGAGNAVAMIALVILFGFAFCWVAALLGLFAKDAETAQVSSFMIIFPMIFASSAYVPISTMPGWLQAFASRQPITQVVNAARYLSQGTPAPGAIWKSLLWIVVILAVFAPLAIRRYRKRT